MSSFLNIMFTCMYIWTVSEIKQYYPVVIIINIKKIYLKKSQTKMLLQITTAGIFHFILRDRKCTFIVLDVKK